jgi:5,10-methylenetetrahydromethanopterin reductase
MEAATSFVAPLARFQVIQGNAAGPQTEEEKNNFAALLSYDMNKHGRPIDKDKLKEATLTPQFVQRFAIVGPPDHCIERLLELYTLGIERFVIVGPGYHPEVNSNGPELFTSEVMPAVRQEIASRGR